MEIITTLVIIIAIATIVLGLFTFLRNPKRYQNTIFFMMTIAIGLWMSVNYLSGATSVMGVTEKLYLADYVIAPFTTLLIMLFCHNIFTQSTKKSHFGAYSHIFLFVLAAFFSVLAALSQIVEVELVSGESKQTEQALFLPYIIIVSVFLVMSVAYIVRARFKAKGIFKTQVSIVLLGMGVMIFLGAAPSTILHFILEEDGSALTTAESLSYLGIFIFTASSSYAIVKHQLFDPRLALIRFLAYVLSFASFILSVTIVTALAAAYIFDFDVSGSDILIYVLVTALALISFPYVKFFFDSITTRIFYQDKYDGMSIRVKLLKMYTTNVKLSVIMNKTLEEITAALKPKHFHIVVFNADSKAVFVHNGRGDNRKIEKSFSKALEDDDEYILTDDRLGGGRIRKLLSSNNVDLLMRLNDDNKSTGYLLLGPKSNGSVYYDEDIYFLSAVVRNFSLAVSNSKKFEQLEGFNVTLQEEVDRATKSLKRSNEKLKEHDIAKNEFMSMTSHQLKPQLTAVQNFAAMLEDDKGLKEEQLDLVQLCRRGVERSLSIITGILDLPQFDTMDLKLNKTKLDLVDLVKNEIKRFDSIVSKRDIKIVVKTPKSVKAEVDNTKLAEAFSNIVRNAIYYSPDGTEVRVTLSTKKKCAVFEVHDSGQGVPASERKKLFTKFYRSTKAKKVQPSGTGIGLFFLKKVVEVHDGEAFYKPGKPGGSVFGFKIPIN